MQAKSGWLLLFLTIALVLFAMGLAMGSVDIPLAEVWLALTGELTGPHGVIVAQVRLPEVITAAAAGAGLAAAGLLMQTVFHNPLAGPGVLGVSGGSALGVAVVMLARPMWQQLPLHQDLLVLIAALLGAVAVLVLIIMADRRIGDGVTLLIMGLMVGYLTSSLVNILQAAGESRALKDYVLWGMGSFAGVEAARLPWLLVPVVIGLLAALFMMKPLNALLTGDDHARSMGVDVERVRRLAILTTGLLTAVVTACCGPIAFLGLAVPHVARAFLRSADHRLLMPGTILMGALLALACDLVVRVPWGGRVLPLNTVTSLLGAPVVVWVLLSGRNWGRR